MSNGILSRLVEDGKRSTNEARSESYVMINVRPGEKVGALLDLMARLTGKTPSVLMADKLSEALADLAQSSANYAPAILEAATQALKDNRHMSDGALSILVKKGVLEFDSPYSRKLDLLSPKASGEAKAFDAPEQP